MPVDMFLKLDPIKGESLDSKHKDQIDIQSYSFGASQGGGWHSGTGGGKGKVDIQDMHFTHYVDAASSGLFQATTQAYTSTKPSLWCARRAARMRSNISKSPSRRCWSAAFSAAAAAVTSG